MNPTDSDLESLNPDEGADTSPLAIWLTEARTAKGLSVHELGGLSGLSPAAIYKIKQGITRNLKEAIRKKLESALGLAIPEETAKEIAEESEVVGLGNLEDFDPHNPPECPTGPGIYVFYDISERPIYVGQSQNVRARIAEHQDKFWFKRPIVESASWIRIGDADLRKKIEQLMIRFLKRNAVINKQHVEGSSRRIFIGKDPLPPPSNIYQHADKHAESILKAGPLHIDELFKMVISRGGKCKNPKSLDSLLRLHLDRFEHAGNRVWRLRKQ
jgi:transcriptional regulator with XRE-family HTH domain